MPLPVVQQGGQDRQVVHQCFPARRRRGNDHVAAGQGGSDPFDLMGVQRRERGRTHDLRDHRGQVAEVGDIARFTRRDDLVMHDSVPHDSTLEEVEIR